MNRVLLVLGGLVMAAMPVCGAEEARDYTCFQIGGGYTPEIDIAADVAIAYGVDGNFAERAELFRRNGYLVSMMTGIAWGGYGSYYGSGENFKKDEVQTTKTGRLYMHGDSTDVGYNVPTDAYIEYIKKYIEPAVDAGVAAVYLEEPEFWAETGWSKAFQDEWARFYGEPWQAPDSSPDAQYRASKLKYEMYFKALKEVFAHAKARAASQGRSIECHVPTHSLINYAQWRIVSPESHLSDIGDFDGYVAQVWTGTARSHNKYRGLAKERTFETAFLEFGQMLGMTRPTGKKVWFLADPIEDNPNYSWNNYKINYECTIIASLMWPEVYRFEVMPWPDRIFQGTYPKVDMDKTSGEREGIPTDYASEILTVINALNEMKQSEVRYDTGSRGVGVLVSDTLMFQRAAPQPSDSHLGSFYSLALPFVKNGVPVEVVQLENTPIKTCLEPYSVLFLTYEGQKPLKPEYHDALAAWVKAGGCLVYVGDDTDPYDHVREWWNDQGKTDATPSQDLFARLGITEKARSKFERVGEGLVRVLWDKPRELQMREDGPETILDLARRAFDKHGKKFKTQNYLLLHRGPFVIASVMDESLAEGPLTIADSYVDLFNPALPVVTDPKLNPNERALLYELSWPLANGITAKVIAASARIRNERTGDNWFEFNARGPINTHCNACILLPSAPTGVKVEPEIPVESNWDAEHGLLRLSFDNQAKELAFHVDWQP